MSYLVAEILRKAENNFADNPEAKRLATLDILTDITWEISTAKKIIAMIKEEIVNWSDNGIYDYYVKIRKEALAEKEAELSSLQESFNEALQILNK